MSVALSNASRCPPVQALMRIGPAMSATPGTASTPARTIRRDDRCHERQIYGFCFDPEEDRRLRMPNVPDEKRTKRLPAVPDHRNPIVPARLRKV